MSNDFYSAVTQSRLTMLAAEEQASLADLAASRANSDTESAASALQQLANLRAERSNLLSLHQEYVASQQPQRQPEPSPEERAARPWSRMDYSDVLEMARNSKYAKDLTWNSDMQAGYEETRRRRARGE